MSEAQLHLLYARATTPADLPWYREHVPDLLVEVVTSRRPGRALDIGCGTGEHAVWLAQRGWNVTGIDLVDRAIAFAQARNRAAGTMVDFVLGDVVAPARSAEPFDLVLDVGCLSSWTGTDQHAAYRANLMTWLAPGGDVYLSYLRRLPVRDGLLSELERFPHEAIVTLFAGLQLRQHRTDLVNLPYPIGPTCLVGDYWFRRASGTKVFDSSTPC